MCWTTCFSSPPVSEHWAVFSFIVNDCTECMVSTSTSLRNWPPSCNYTCVHHHHHPNNAPHYQTCGKQLCTKLPCLLSPTNYSSNSRAWGKCLHHSVYSHHPHVVHACLHGNSVSAAGMSIVLLGLNCKISSTFSTITISSVDQLPSIMSSAWLNCKNFKHLWHHHDLLCGSIAIHHPKQLCHFCFRTCELHKTLRSMKP